MKLDQIISETPQIVAPTDFGIGDLNKNATLARRFLRRKQEIIFDRPDFEIFRTGDQRNGNIVLYNKRGQKLDYWVHYTARPYSQIGMTVTQLKLWRNQASPYVQGITRWIFFDYLLQKYPAVMSDGQQTKDGQGFWIGRMAEATARRLRVALVNLNHRQVIWFNPQIETFESWIATNNAWGNTEPLQAFRYLIAN